MTTVGEYVGKNADRGEQMVTEAYRVVEVNHPTVVEDAICDLLHLLESIHSINGTEWGDAREQVLEGVRRSLGHWFAESVYAETDGDADKDELGGAPIYEVEISYPTRQHHGA